MSSEPDQIDMMSESELRDELRRLIASITPAPKPAGVDVWCVIDTVDNEPQFVHRVTESLDTKEKAEEIYCGSNDRVVKATLTIEE